MCGIVGYSGNINIDPSEMKSMLIMAQSRGGDSTGYATRDKIEKEAKNARTFCRGRDFPETDLYIGHTRLATVGAISNRNSHPFEEDSLVGVHNGGIGNFWELQRQEGTTFQVDSEIIWHMIDKYGLEEGIPKLRGGMALAWIQDEKLHLYRHSNPIWVGYKKDQFYFGSEEKYLSFLECKDIKSLKEHTHYIVEGDEIVSEEEAPKPKAYAPRTNHYNWQSDSQWCGTRRYKNKKKETTPKVSEDDDSSVRKHFPPTYAPDDAEFIYAENNYVVYFWFDENRPEVVNIEMTYPALQYNFVEPYNVLDEDKLNEVKRYNNEVYKHDKFKETLNNLKNR